MILSAFASPLTAEGSGIFITSSARARLGRRRMKPRSSSALISRCTPDFDFRSSASFISSNEGEMPDVLNRSLMRSEEHTSELQSLMRISYAVFCLNKKNINNMNYRIDTLHTHINLRYMNNTTSP